MTKRNAIDEAFRRGRILSSIIIYARERAKNSPFDERWVDCGLLVPGQTKEQAIKSINETFDKLSEFIEYVTVLDMAGSFEQASSSRIKNHIGEGKKRIKKKSSGDNLPDYREKLFRGTNEFQGLISFWQLIEGQAGVSLTENFEAIRDTRNKIAHGSYGDGAPSIDTISARDALKALFDLI